MDEGLTRTRREPTLRQRAAAIGGDRPDRPALWALLLGVGLMALAAATADASGGGVTRAGSGGTGSTAEVNFGSRVLRVGMEGEDVRVMNGIVTSKGYGRATAVSDVFENPTATAIREFQRRWELPQTGVVNRTTAKTLTLSMKRAGATWYGPGFYGNRTACGRVLRAGTVGVAHRSLPCGTKVTFAYHGRHLVVPVIDRGPYRPGYHFDLTNGAREALGFDYSDQIRYAIAR
jgi:rare lipoprotein A (peptidoglycan hydrolase)